MAIFHLLQRRKILITNERNNQIRRNNQAQAVIISEINNRVPNLLNRLHPSFKLNMRYQSSFYSYFRQKAASNIFIMRVAMYAQKTAGWRTLNI
mmetsp:Transcript_29007/g.70743  ORF Transcript_29007/g.70743 Transcript_29007/m.70743 type:complete len:94 (-) Transcript_29007:28-309(-)